MHSKFQPQLIHAGFKEWDVVVVEKVFVKVRRLRERERVADSISRAARLVALWGKGQRLLKNGAMRALEENTRTKSTQKKVDWDYPSPLIALFLHDIL